MRLVGRNTPSSAPLGVGGTAPYDPIFLFAERFSLLRGGGVPPLPPQAVSSCFSLALDFILLPRSGKTQYRTAGQLLSSSLPLCEDWRLCSCGCGAKPPPVPRGGARFPDQEFGFAKRKDSRLLNVSLVQITSTPTTSPLQVIGEWTDGARLVLDQYNRTVIVPQLQGGCQYLSRSSCKKFSRVTLCELTYHQLVRSEPLQNDVFVSRAEVAGYYHFLPFHILRKTKTAFCIIGGMLPQHKLTLILVYHTTKQFASPWLIFARWCRLLALRCSR